MGWGGGMRSRGDKRRLATGGGIGMRRARVCSALQSGVQKPV
jgi:hypothetical protein